VGPYPPPRVYAPPPPLSSPPLFPPFPSPLALWLSLISPQCGDLNLVALLHVVWLIVINGGLGNRAANTMAAAKLAMAYLGQWAHRMAHTPHSQRPEWVRAAQSLGALVSPILHKAHHTTYDDGFPILSGVTAPVVSAFNHWVPNRYLWLWAFAVLSLADVQLCTMLCTAYFPVLAGKGAAAEVSWFRF
jgi:hypothetical protein